MKFEKKDYQNIFFSYVSMQEPIFSLMIKIIPKWCMDEVLKIIHLSCSLVFWEIYDVEDNPLALCIFIAPFSSNANNFALDKSSSFE